jgi:hypothetical protein
MLNRHDREDARRDTPQNWESLASKAPTSWEKYARADGLERWTAEQDEALERDVAETTRRIEGLDQKLRPMARRALGKAPSPAWRIILGALVVSAWDSARRMGGQHEACVARFAGSRRTPFMTARAALEFAVYHQPLIGLGSRRLAPALDRPRDIAARMKARAAGCDVRAPRTTPGGRGVPRGLGAVELRADVLGAVRASRIGAVELWLVVASTVGELQKRARRTKAGVEEALIRRRAGELVERLATMGFEADLDVVRDVIGGARERLTSELEARGLIPWSPPPANDRGVRALPARIVGLPLPDLRACEPLPGH